MELQRIADIIRFKKTADNGIQSPSIEEAQELARMYLIATGQAYVLQFRDPDPKCEICKGVGYTEADGNVSMCKCTIIDNPIILIPDAPEQPEPEQPAPEPEEPAKDGD